MVTLNVQDATAAILKELAQARGLSIDDYLLSIARAQAVIEPLSVNGDAAQDFDDALDELFANDTRQLPAVSLSYSRRDIYTDHD